MLNFVSNSPVHITDMYDINMFESIHWYVLHLSHSAGFIVYFKMRNTCTDSNDIALVT